MHTYAPYLRQVKTPRWIKFTLSHAPRGFARGRGLPARLAQNPAPTLLAEMGPLTWDEILHCIVNREVRVTIGVTLLKNKECRQGVVA